MTGAAKELASVKLVLADGGARSIPIRFPTGELTRIYLARANADKGFVIDYDTKSGTVGSFTFQANSTYYIAPSTTFNISVTAIFQPNTVIKFGFNGILYLYTYPTFTSTTALPAIFTSKDDNLFGDEIAGSTGNPALSLPYFTGLWIYYTQFNSLVKNARFRWAGTGVEFDCNVYVNHTVDNCQFEHCQIGVYNYLPQGQLTLTATTHCGTKTPLGGPPPAYLTGSMNADCRPVNGTHMLGWFPEPTLAINPLNRSNIVIFGNTPDGTPNGNHALARGISNDGGATLVLKLNRSGRCISSSLLRC